MAKGLLYPVNIASSINPLVEVVLWVKGKVSKWAVVLVKSNPDIKKRTTISAGNLHPLIVPQLIYRQLELSRLYE